MGTTSEHPDHDMSNRVGEKAWDGIADLSRDLDPRPTPLEMIRKRLEPHRFTVGDRAMGLGVQVAPFFGLVKLCSDREGRATPPKTTEEISAATLLLDPALWRQVGTCAEEVPPIPAFWNGPIPLEGRRDRIS